MSNKGKEYPQRRCTVEQVQLAIRQSAGNLSYAARELGVSRSTVERHVAKSKMLQATLRDTREELVDIAESALRRQVLKGNTTAILFTLKTQGKDRGYVTRREISGPDGAGIPIAVVRMPLDEL